MPQVLAVQPEFPVFEPGAKGLGVYHSYTSLTTELEAYAATYPGICRLYTTGQSVQGRELWAVLITDNPDIEEDEPEFKYVGSMHGDEPVGMELCLYFLDALLTGYGTDERITQIVDGTAVWILPLMNPDGLEIGWRYNASRLDLNRSFPAFPEDFSGTVFDDATLEPSEWPAEVAHVMQWTLDNSFVLSANLHTGALVVNYPYDDDNKGSVDSPTPDDLMFEDVSRRYSIHNLPLWNSAEFEDGITNGAAWYSIDGGMQDWNYRYVACNEVTLELSNTKKPSASLLPTYWADNRESMLSYLEAVHMGVRGVVTDRDTGAPLWAEVTVADNAQPVFTDPDVGDYHRMLLPGTYNLDFSAPGHITRTVPGVVVSDGAAARVDVALADPDIDNDGVVGATDLQLVVLSILGNPPPYDCDLDGGGVSATDLQKLINVILTAP